MAKPFGRVMYLMQQLEKLFNEITLCANVARPRCFAVWSSILPNCLDTTLRGVVSSQNVGTESCTVVLYLTGHGFQGSPWNHCMSWSDTEPTDNQLDATAGTLQETTTSPLHRNKFLAQKCGQIQKQMKKTRTLHGRRNSLPWQP